MSKSLEEKYLILKDAFREQPFFGADDVAALFPEYRRASINRILHKLCEDGHLIRARKGVPAGGGTVVLVKRKKR